MLLSRIAEEVRKERKKATKNDAVVRLASAINEDGRAGVEAEWERTADFHLLWKNKSRDMLARAEWRRRKLTKRVCPAKYSGLQLACNSQSSSSSPLSVAHLIATCKASPGECAS